MTQTHKEEKEMRSEYDFTTSVRGKHYKKMQAGFLMTIHKSDGTTVVKEVKPQKGMVFLEPDIEAWFPDSESVNKALRCLLPLLREKHESK
jgi:hypothetical protein